MNMLRKVGHLSKQVNWSLKRCFTSTSAPLDDVNSSKSDSKRTWKWTKRFAKLGLLIGATGGAFYASTRGTVFQPHKAPYIHLQEGEEAVDPDPFHRNKLLPENMFLVLRFVHTLSVLVSMLMDYGIVFGARELAISLEEEAQWLKENGQTQFEDYGIEPNTIRKFHNLANKSERRKQQESMLHERSAVKLQNQSVLNGGCYIKLAQHIANLGHGIPAEYVRVLGVLQDRAPLQPLSRMLGVLADAYEMDVLEEHINEFGIVSGPLSTLYKQIDVKPIAAASLAQVHRGVTADGQTVAIKIQYGYLSKLMEGDLATVKACIRLAEMAFPRLELAELEEEFAAGLRGEVNFVREVQNAERSARLLHGLVEIPYPRWDLTSPRVTVSSFIRGLPITDTAGMCAALLHPHRVSKDLLAAFSHMLFVSGYVHCDPHPGNALVRLEDARVEREEHPHKYNFNGHVPSEVVYGQVRMPASPTGFFTWPLSLLVAHMLLPVKLAMLGTSILGETIGWALTTPAPPPPVEVRTESKYSKSLVYTHVQYGLLGLDATTTTYVFPSDRPEIVFSRAPPFSDNLLRFLEHSLGFLLYPMLVPGSSVNPVDWLAPPSFRSASFSSSIQLRTPKVVLLDHGLYREFAPSFRTQFTTLFYSFFRRDDEAAKQAAIDIGMGEYWELLFFIFAHRPAFSSASIGSNSISKEEQIRLRKKFRTLDLQDIISTLSADLAFAMKTISLLRSVSAQLLLPRSDRLAVFFDGALRGVYERPCVPNYEDPSALARVVVAAPFATKPVLVTTDDQVNTIAQFLHTVLRLQKKVPKQQHEHKYLLGARTAYTPELLPSSELFVRPVGETLIKEDPFGCHRLTPLQLELLRAPHSASCDLPQDSGLVRLDLRQCNRLSFVNNMYYAVDKVRAYMMFSLYEAFVANKGNKVIG